MIRNQSLSIKAAGLAVFLVACAGGAATTTDTTATTTLATGTTATTTVLTTTGAVTESTSTTAGEITSGGLGAELISPGQVVVCMTFPVPLVADYDAAGNPIGQSVEFVLDLADRLDLDPELRNTIFDLIIDDIEAGNCDFSLAGHFITPERLARIDMIPYLRGRQQLVVQSGNPEGLDDVIDLCGEPVSVRAGTVQEEMVLGLGLYEAAGINDSCTDSALPMVDVVAFPGEFEAVESLLAGEVVAYMGGTTWLADYPDDLEVVPAVVLPDFINAMGVRKDHPLLAEALRAALDAMIADGTYHAIQSKWGVGIPLGE